MKVLIATGLYPPEIGGPATYSKLLETELPKRGIEVVVLPFRAVRRYPRVIRHIAYFFMLIKARHGVDIIFAQDPLSVGLPASLASLVLQKIFILKIVGDYAWEQATQRSGYLGTPEEFQSASVGVTPTLLRILERFVAWRAARIVVPSKYLADIVQLWGVDAKKITVIYNGVTIGDVGVKEVIRGVLNFKGRLLISVGRLVPWKGFDVLIKVFAKLKKKFPDLTLFIAGDGPDADRLLGIAQKNRIEQSIIFSGAVDHDALLRYVKAADVFVLNTSYEGFSHQILETMAVGVPVVTTHVGGNPEIITDGQTGYLVKPNDESALASRITGLLERRELYQRITTAAQAHVASFSDIRLVVETATLLKSL